MTWLTNAYEWLVRRAIRFRWMTVGIAAAAFAASVWMMVSGAIGSEFLPHLDEGAIWARATLAPSTGPSTGVAVMDRRADHDRVVSGSDAGGVAGGASR